MVGRCCCKVVPNEERRLLPARVARVVTVEARIPAGSGSAQGHEQRRGRQKDAFLVSRRSRSHGAPCMQHAESEEEGMNSACGTHSQKWLPQSKPRGAKSAYSKSMKVITPRWHSAVLPSSRLLPQPAPWLPPAASAAAPSSGTPSNGTMMLPAARHEYNAALSMCQCAYAHLRHAHMRNTPTWAECRHAVY